MGFIPCLRYCNYFAAALSLVFSSSDFCTGFFVHASASPSKANEFMNDNLTSGGTQDVSEFCGTITRTSLLWTCPYGPVTLERNPSIFSLFTHFSNETRTFFDSLFPEIVRSAINCRSYPPASGRGVIVQPSYVERNRLISCLAKLCIISWLLPIFNQ